MAGSSSGTVNIRIVSAMPLHLLLHVLVAHGNHGSLRTVGATVDALALLAALGGRPLVSNEHNIALVDASVVGAAMRPLLVASAETRSTSIILLSNGVSAHVLPVVAKIEE